MNSYDKIMKQLDDYSSELKRYVEDKKRELNAEGKSKAQKLYIRTEAAIEIVKEKIKEKIDFSSDNDELQETLKRIENKVLEIINYTKGKIDEIKPIKKDDSKEENEESKAITEDDILKLKDEICAFEDKSSYTCGISQETYDELKKDHVFDRLCSSLNKVLDEAIYIGKEIHNRTKAYLNKPETKQKINKVKTKIVKVAELGLKKLKEVLKVEEELK